MPTLSHNTAVKHLLGSRTAKEGVPLAKQLMFFALLWIIITASISYIGRDNLSAERPMSWLMVVFPLMGLYIFFVAYDCYLFWKNMGKSSLFLAKDSFHCSDNIKGYVEFKDLKWNGKTEASAYISLQKKQSSENNQVEWSTKAQTQSAPGNTGIRVSFSCLVKPMLNEPPSSKVHTWCLHITLKHNNVTYKESFSIPMCEAHKR